MKICWVVLCYCEASKARQEGKASRQGKQARQAGKVGKGGDLVLEPHALGADVLTVHALASVHTATFGDNARRLGRLL
jgi:hypothetical protein